MVGINRLTTLTLVTVTLALTFVECKPLEEKLNDDLERFRKLLGK